MKNVAKMQLLYVAKKQRVAKVQHLVLQMFLKMNSE